MMAKLLSGGGCFDSGGGCSGREEEAASGSLRGGSVQEKM